MHTLYIPRHCREGSDHLKRYLNFALRSQEMLGRVLWKIATALDISSILSNSHQRFVSACRIR